jgi:hypothetical protein
VKYPQRRRLYRKRRLMWSLQIMARGRRRAAKYSNP